MTSTIQKLKKNLSEAKSKCDLELKYKEKTIKTKIATTKRINAQLRQNIQRDKERLIELRQREEAVFGKILSYLKGERDNLGDIKQDWTVIIQKMASKISRFFLFFSLFFNAFCPLSSLFIKY